MKNLWQKFKNKFVPQETSEHLDIEDFIRIDENDQNLMTQNEFNSANLLGQLSIHSQKTRHMSSFLSSESEKTIDEEYSKEKTFTSNPLNLLNLDPEDDSNEDVKKINSLQAFYRKGDEIKAFIDQSIRQYEKPIKILDQKKAQLEFDFSKFKEESYEDFENKKIKELKNK